MPKISQKDIVKLLSQWGKEFTVLVPSKESGVGKIAAWDGKDTGFLEWYRNTVIPAKASLFPPVEEMFTFQKDKAGYKLETPAVSGHKRLIFGIRPCDASALAMLDRVFGEGYEDPYYLSLRKNTVLVGLTCTNPYDSCFCTSLGGTPSDPANVDIMFSDIGDGFLIDAVSETGRDLVARTGRLEEATRADDKKAQEVKAAAYSKVTRKIDTTGISDRLLACFENGEHWERVASRCISCGICTFLCPTCYCFDINDELIKKQGTRFRSWDSCAFPVYTKMPMENPRLEKWRRVRQKVCHKYGFYPMNFGAIACTGCGRCIRLCPVNWDITQTLANLP